MTPTIKSTSNIHSSPKKVPDERRRTDARPAACCCLERQDLHAARRRNGPSACVLYSATVRMNASARNFCPARKDCALLAAVLWHVSLELFRQGRLPN
jgi:hypothetical protein